MKKILITALVAFSCFNTQAEEKGFFQKVNESRIMSGAKAAGFTVLGSGFAAIAGFMGYEAAIKTHYIIADFGTIPVYQPQTDIGVIIAKGVPSVFAAYLAALCFKHAAKNGSRAIGFTK